MHDVESDPPNDRMPLVRRPALLEKLAVSIEGRETNNVTENDLFVFTHIPKTAGTTFKRLLERQFRASQMPKIGPDYQASVDQIKSLSTQDKDRVRCLSGHLPFGIHQYFPKKTLHYVGFVRDPIDRAVSEYFFFSRQPQLMPLLGLDAGTTMSPQEFWEHQSSIGMMDFQARVLSGYDNMVESVMPPYKPMPVENADSIIRGIVDSFAMLGTVEQFDESLVLMKQKFGWRNICYIRRNVTPVSQKKLQLRKEVSEQISSLNPIDCKLYAHIREMIDAKIAEQGESFTREFRRFRFYNRWYTPAWNVYRATGLRRLHKIMAKAWTSTA